MNRPGASIDKTAALKNANGKGSIGRPKKQLRSTWRRPEFPQSPAESNSGNGGGGGRGGRGGRRNSRGGVRGGRGGRGGSMRVVAGTNTGKATPVKKWEPVKVKPTPKSPVNRANSGRRGSVGRKGRRGSVGRKGSTTSPPGSPTPASPGSPDSGRATKTTISVAELVKNFQKPGSKNANQGSGKTLKRSASTFLIEKKDLKFGEAVGEGAFGAVYQGEYQGVEVAIKACFNKDSNETLYTDREVKMLRSVRHPNIVQYIGLCKPEDDEMYIVTEFVPRGTIRDRVMPPEKPSWRLITRLCLDMAKGFNYLHSRKLMHRDVKSDNILIDANYRAKIIDLGFARGVSEAKRTKRPMTMLGTEDWMSPEVILSMDYNELSDVFGYGLILAELVTRTKIGDVLQREIPGFGIPYDDLAANAFKGCPQDLLYLTRDCLEVEPDQRPSFAEIIPRLETIFYDIEWDGPLPGEEAQGESGSIQKYHPRANVPQHFYRRHADESVNLILQHTSKDGPPITGINPFPPSQEVSSRKILYGAPLNDAPTDDPVKLHKDFEKPLSLL